MSAIVWGAIQKANAQAIKQNNLALAAKALANGIEPNIIQKLFKLTNVEFQDLLDGTPRFDRPMPLSCFYLSRHHFPMAAHTALLPDSTAGITTSVPTRSNAAGIHPLHPGGIFSAPGGVRSIG